MAIVFDFSNKKKRPVKQEVKKEQPKLVELVKHIDEAIPASLTYIDVDGIEKNVEGSYHKDKNGSYYFNKTEIETYDVYDKVSYSYQVVNPHFAYIDKDGVKRVFNKMETLEYNEETNTYTGIGEDIHYITNEIEVFEDKN
jgi:hypothetical protein